MSSDEQFSSNGTETLDEDIQETDSANENLDISAEGCISNDEANLSPDDESQVQNEDENNSNATGKKSIGKKKHTAIKVIISVVLLGAIIAASFFANRGYKVWKSKDSFQAAKECEEKGDYESAISCYSAVIPEDTENYSVAVKKTKELELKIAYLKNCAKAVVAASVDPMFSESNITDIYYAERGSAYATFYGEGTVAIIAPVMSTECTFLVVPKKNYLLDYSNFPCAYNNEFSVYVYGIGTENYTQGWLKGGFDAVTDTYVTMAKQRGICADKEMVLKYVDKYYSTKDKTIFE